MTERNITLVGTVLILLIAICITIVLGGPKLASSSVGALQPRTLTLKTLKLEQARLTLPLLNESSVALQHGLKSELKLALGHELQPELKAELNSLLATARGLKLRLDLNDRLLNVASNLRLTDNLPELLPTA